jgi:hypothetical protein
MLLFLALQASAQTRMLELQIHDYAGLQPSTLQSFSNYTLGILSSAGVSIQLNICSGANTCEVQSTMARILVLRIVAGSARKMNNVFRSPLGQSYADHTGGTYASVFLEPVQVQAAEADVPWPMVLAYAAAHEVGHLLLGDQAHTQRGLMKAHWDDNDFRDMKQDRLHFIKDQARRLARCCASPWEGTLQAATQKEH